MRDFRVVGQNDTGSCNHDQEDSLHYCVKTPQNKSEKMTSLNGGSVKLEVHFQKFLSENVGNYGLNYDN